MFMIYFIYCVLTNIFQFLLLLLALEPTVGFRLLSDFLPFRPSLYTTFFTLLFPLSVYILRCPQSSGFGGLGVACWPLVPKFTGSNPAETVEFLRAKKSSARLPSEGK